MKLLDGMSPKEVYLTRENELLKHKLHYWERRYSNETIMPTFEDAQVHTILSKDISLFRVAVAGREVDLLDQRHHLYARIQGPDKVFQMNYYLSEPQLRSINEVAAVGKDMLDQVVDQLVKELAKHVEK